MSVKSIVKAIDTLLPREGRPFEHHAPSINGSEAAFVAECLKSDPYGAVSVKRLELALAEYCGVRHAVATSSGTTALHLALLAVGVKPDTEVLVPSLTFAATANAVCHVGAVPNFIDGSLGINAYKLRRYLEQNTKPADDKRGRVNKKTGRTISALIVVDLLGFPADMPRLSAVTEEFGLILIEDAAQALGAHLGNQRCGSFGAAAILSFNGNKIVTGMGGGAFLTNDEWLAAKAWDLGNTARVPHHWLIEHKSVAFNYRMTGLTAAMILAQLDRIDEFLGAKLGIVSMYLRALEGCPDIDILTAKELWQGRPNYWLATAVLKPLFEGQRDAILKLLHRKDIRARALFTPLHKLDHFADCPRQANMSMSEDAFSRIICLPSGVALCEQSSSQVAVPTKAPSHP